ncbi:MAG: 3-deoxy-D-manno-octulosonic acid transferase [Planctomycetota bacterium]|jgi:3-deoxy-D-manno-octulosonic-acid transferase
MRFLIDFAYLLAAAVYAPLLFYRMIRYGRYRQGWAQRFGKINRKKPDKNCIWLHAVSVGEVNAAKTIVKELENRFSDFEILITATTDTGFARANELFATSHTVVYFPFDFSLIMNRAFRRIRPVLCVLMEQEVWPNFVQIAQNLNVPVIVVNGRISDKGYARFKKIKPFAKIIFQKVNLILAQTEEYAQRFKEIGTPEDKVIVTGSLKYDTAQITDNVDGAYTLKAQLALGSERLWVAGATGNDEEKILLEVYRRLRQQDQFSDLRLVIVPRKPERFDEVAQLIEQQGLPLIRYSHVKDGKVSPSDKKGAIILGDTMGDLRKFYSLATVIFVGRSLVPMGGSDMMEAAALGKPTLFGPYAFNFRQTVNALLKGNGAIMVKDKKELLEEIQKCLTDADFASQIAENGQNVIKQNQGATEKTIEQIEKSLC